ncbi:hypothetical protein C5949_19160, partial [Cronobacter sakazakii]
MKSASVVWKPVRPPICASTVRRSLKSAKNRWPANRRRKLLTLTAGFFRRILFFLPSPCLLSHTSGVLPPLLPANCIS